MSGKFYITTPIYYVNDKPHIGHAYTTILADVLSRYHRAEGDDVFFLTGLDEHGQKVQQAAEKRNVEPKQHCDEMAPRFLELWDKLHISNDDFIRTTEARHTRACQALWTKLVDAGEIYLGSYAGWYAVRDEAFYTESELTSTSDGKKIAASGAEVEWVEEPSYFFRLSAWQDKLLDFYEANPNFIAPISRRNEVISFAKGGLRDLSVSRTTDRKSVV